MSGSSHSYRFAGNRSTRTLCCSLCKSCYIWWSTIFL